jgi:hypothetical protein
LARDIKCQDKNIQDLFKFLMSLKLNISDEFSARVMFEPEFDPYYKSAQWCGLLSKQIYNDILLKTHLLHLHSLAVEIPAKTQLVKFKKPHAKKR